MAKQTPSPADAFRIVYDALEPLAAEERQRVVASVLALFGTAVQGGTRPQPGAAPTMTSTAAATTSRPLSLIEFMDEKKPVSNPQKIAAFAFYRERYEGAPRFARADLKAYFPKARIAPASNFDRDFGKAVQMGWIHEDSADSYLTTKGVERVEAGFGGKRVYRRGSGSSRPVRKKKAGTSSKAR